jgi:peptidoglycan L-alanyl-D-glutamate endopeptidase CwlK
MAKGGPYIFGGASEAQIVTCTPGIIKVVRRAIKIYDFSASEGHRSVARQQALFAQGRTTPGKIVTNVDGVRKKGMHNYKPSRAIDLVPYRDGKMQWNDREGFIHLAGIMLAFAEAEGVRLRWGGDWNMDDDFGDGWDLPHFEELL